MLIVGAKGFAKEVLQVLHEENKHGNVVFFDDVSHDILGFIFDKFPIIPLAWAHVNKNLVLILRSALKLIHQSDYQGLL